jgi:hypothetical protein
MSIFPSSLLEALNGLVDRLNESSPCVRVLLIGTNEGVSLSRCYGSSRAVLREDILASVETAWATLPSGCAPQVLASAWAQNSGTAFHQPAHPLLRPVGLGDTIQSVVAFYDSLTLIHFHLSPLVVTILATPQVNINLIQSVALPILKLLLEPVAQAIVAVRKGAGTESDSDTPPTRQIPTLR